MTFKSHYRKLQLMRMLEILLSVSICLVIVLEFIKSFKYAHQIKFVPFLLAIIQFAIEKPRWQMVPAYVAAIILSILFMLSFIKTVTKKALVAPGVLCLISIVFTILMPHFTLPKPTGPWSVGQTIIYPIENDDSSPAAIVFYPADSHENHAKAKYLEFPKISIELSAKSQGLPGFVLSHLALISTHSYQDAPPVRDRKFPVLFSLHPDTIGGRYFDLVHLNEEIASRGFIVISPAHREISQLTPISKNKYVQINEKINEELTIEFQNAQDAFGKFMKLYTLSDRELLNHFPEFNAASPIKNSIIAKRTKDVSSLVNNLIKLRRIELENADWRQLGIFGWSSGGNVALNLTFFDPRFKAAVNLDGFYYSALLKSISSLKTPILTISSQDTHSWQPDMNKFINPHFRGPNLIRHIKGSRHRSFGHYYLISPFAPAILGLGSINGNRMQEIVSEELHWFFGQYLKGEEIPEPRFEEVLEIR